MIWKTTKIEIEVLKSAKVISFDPIDFAIQHAAIKEQLEEFKKSHTFHTSTILKPINLSNDPKIISSFWFVATYPT